MILHRMTWPEVRRIDFDKTVALVPLGSTEQHGPHLPTNTDTFIVTRLAEELERRHPDHILLTPALWLGHSPHHLSFGGTLSAYHPVYIDMVVSICESYIQMGAKKIWLLNGHGGNRAPLAIVLQELKNRHKRVRAVASEYWNIARESISAIRESGTGGLGHACELETSLYLYLDESQVRKDLIQDDGNRKGKRLFPLDMLQGGPVAETFDFDEITDSGVNGMPTLATKEKGERFFRGIVEALDQFAVRLIEL